MLFLVRIKSGPIANKKALLAEIVFALANKGEDAAEAISETLFLFFLRIKND